MRRALLLVMDPKDLSLKVPGPADAPVCPRR
jgi:hypothetical protein